MKDFNHELDNFYEACGFNICRFKELTTGLAKELGANSNRSRMVDYIESMAKKYPEFLRMTSLYSLEYIESLLDAFVKHERGE